MERKARSEYGRRILAYLHGVMLQVPLPCPQAALHFTCNQINGLCTLP